MNDYNSILMISIHQKIIVLIILFYFKYKFIQNFNKLLNIIINLFNKYIAN